MLITPMACYVYVSGKTLLTPRKNVHRLSKRHSTFKRGHHMGKVTTDPQKLSK